MGRRIKIRPKQDTKQETEDKCFVCGCISGLTPYYRIVRYSESGSLKGKVYLCHECFSAAHFWLTNTKSKKLNRWNVVSRMRKYCEKHSKTEMIGHIHFICRQVQRRQYESTKTTQNRR